MTAFEATEPGRRGFVRRVDIPPEVLADLNEGRDESRTLAEWLAIDLPRLLRAVLPRTGCSPRTVQEAADLAEQLAGKPIRRRLLAVGNVLSRELKDHPRRDEIFHHLSTHASDMVRSWAAYVLRSDRSLPLPRRLDALRPFATDRSTAVRECAWESLRPHVSSDLERALHLLEVWVESPDENLRRCAVEALRPRGGEGCSHIKALTTDPALASGLLERLRSDPSRYVQRSVANWLDDASKSRPDWVIGLCDRWREESPTRETAWTVSHALRTVRNCDRG